MSERIFFYNRIPNQEAITTNVSTPFLSIETFENPETNEAELSPREIQILLYNAQGYKATDIRRMLSFGIAEQQKDVFTKLGATNAIDAVRKAIITNILTPEMFEDQFDLSRSKYFEEIDIKAIDALSQGEENISDKTIGEKIGLKKWEVTALFKDIREEFSLPSRTAIAAYYLIAMKQGYVENPGITFSDMHHQGDAMHTYSE